MLEILKQLAITVGILLGLISPQVDIKLSGVPIEVQPYYDDYADIRCYKISKDKTVSEIPQEKNYALKQGEMVSCRPTKKETVLQENQYYKTNRHNEASTSAEIMIKLNGIIETKFEDELTK